MKSLKNLAQLGYFALTCLITTGCLDKSYNMIGRECPQVTKHEPSYELIQQYLRSVTLYEGYQTHAHFDVLVMSDQMCAVYAALHSAKVGHNENERTAFLSQLLEENREYLTLYLLAEIADESHISMSDKNSAWSVFITNAHGRIMTPYSIKEVELTPEIRSIFSYRYVSFKKSYCIKFAACDIAGMPYIRPGDITTITFAGAGMAGSLEWTEQALTKEQALENGVLRRQDDLSIKTAFSKIAEPRQRHEDYYFC